MRFAGTVGENQAAELRVETYPGRGTQKRLQVLDVEPPDPGRAIGGRRGEVAAARAPGNGLERSFVPLEDDPRPRAAAPGAARRGPLAHLFQVP